MMEKITAELLKAVEEGAVDGKLTCAAAFGISKKLNVSLKTVGKAADQGKIKIKDCQLGCF